MIKKKQNLSSPRRSGGATIIPTAPRMQKKKKEKRKQIMEKQHNKRQPPHHEQPALALPPPPLRKSVQVGEPKVEQVVKVHLVRVSWRHHTLLSATPRRFGRLVAVGRRRGRIEPRLAVERRPSPLAANRRGRAARPT